MPALGEVVLLLLVRPDANMEKLPPATTITKRDDFVARRKAFLDALTTPSSQRGYVRCRLCSRSVWGPNGRYHMEKCPVISSHRAKALEEGLTLHTISGVRVDEDLFKRPKATRPKPAKLPGFVISSTVRTDDPTVAPSRDDIRDGIRTGRKGYVRCLACNAEIYAPNARHHAATCQRNQDVHIKKKTTCGWSFS